MVKIRFSCAALALSTLLASNAYPFCFEEAGQLYNINPQILRAIAKVESNFDPAALNKNTNGTYDVGLMQINSGWAASLGKERWKSLGDACYNAKTGAWILSQCIGKYGYNWKAIGCYHSQTPEKRDHYARLVFGQLPRVAPRAEEALYDPLKKRLAALVQKEVDGWVEESVKKGVLAQSEEPPPEPPVNVEQPQDMQQIPQQQGEPQGEPPAEDPGAQAPPPDAPPPVQEEPPAENPDLGQNPPPSLP